MREDVVFHQFNSVRSVLKGKELKEVRTTYLEEEEEEEEEKGVFFRSLNFLCVNFGGKIIHV